MSSIVPTRIRTATAALLAVGMFLAGPARGAEPPSYLQMAGMTALAATPDGRRANIPVTVFVQVGSVEAARDLCRRVPAVRAAVLDATSQRPIPYAKGRVDPDANFDFVAERLNAALGNKIVARVAFVHGTPKEEVMGVTDLAEAGDMVAQERAVKSGKAGQTAPCRRIAAPPNSLKWVDAKAERKPAQGHTPPAPPLRENRAPAPPPPSEFKSHPQFAPPAAEPRPRSEAPISTPPPAPIAVVGMPERVEPEKPPSARDCTPLDKIWNARRYPYAGVLYALSRVFTIDSNGDGQTDNIGFVLSASAQPDVIFRYFDEPGRAAIDLFPSLMLKDSRSIAEICFGQFTPEDETPAAGSKIGDPLIVDILQSSRTAAPTVQATGAGFWISFSLIAIGLIGAMSATMVLVRRRRAARATAASAAADDDGGAEEKRRGNERRKQSVPVQTERRAAPDRRKK